MCYFPLTFLAAASIWNIFSGRIRISRSIQIILGITSAIPGVLIIAISLIDSFKEKIISTGWIKDGFALGNLQASGNWTGLETLTGLLFLLVSFWFIYGALKNPVRSVIGIFASSVTLAFFIMTLITPRVEAYSQRAAIEFYTKVANEDSYITTLGFKSYAHLFYGRVKPPVNLSVYEKGWFLKGNIDKPTYIVFKNSRKERSLSEYPELKILYEKNGFVFARRDPK